MSKQKVAVAIKSCHKHADRRAAQLATWLPELDADFFFLIGNPVPVGNDFLYCQTSDAFADIAPKVFLACKYALDENITNLCVCDDDTYIRPERLMQSYFWKGDYIGFMRTSGLDYNQGVPYAQGSAFWLSERSMEHIVQRPDIMVPGVIDDGAVGRCLIDKVRFTHDWRYEPGPYPERAPAPGNNVITTHKCLPAQMLAVHKAWSEQQPGIVGERRG
jgi:hypothetical protein